MKRVLLIASALCIGIAAFVIDTNPGITQAQTGHERGDRAGSAGSGGVRRRSGRALYRSLRPRRIESDRPAWAASSGTRPPAATIDSTPIRSSSASACWSTGIRVLRSDQRDDRFAAWGIINDPACCKPGDPDCPAKSPDETYGFDWCPGDDVLLKYVGKAGLRRSGLRPEGRAARSPGSAHQRRDDRPAPFGVRSQVRHVHGRARPAQVSESALRRAEVEAAERAATSPTGTASASR